MIDHDTHMAMPMRMYFHHDTHDLLLFKGWATQTGTVYAATWIGIVFFTVGYHYMQAMRTTLLEPALMQRLAFAHSALQREGLHMVRAALFTFEAAIGFVIMLVVMTFNIGWCLAILMGIFVGQYMLCRNANACANGYIRVDSENYNDLRAEVDGDAESSGRDAIPQLRVPNCCYLSPKY